MGTQLTDFSTVAAGSYQNGATLNLQAGKTATWSLVGDLDADSEVYLERSSNLFTWEVVQTFVAGALDESGTVNGPYHYRFRLANLGETDQTDALDASIADAVDTLSEVVNDQGQVVQRINEDGVQPEKLYGFLADIVVDATTAITLGEAHKGRILHCTSADPVTVTVPADLAEGYSCTIVAGAGAVTVDNDGTSVVANRQDQFTSAGENALMSLVVLSNTDGASAVAVLGGDTV